MTTVTGSVQDLGMDPMDGTLWARPARFRSDGQVIFAPERKPYKIEAGQVSADLAPGPAVLELQVGSHARGTFEVVIPEEDTTLADLLDSVFAWEPAQVSLFVAEREAAEQAATLAGTAKTDAETAAQQTGQDRTAVAADKDTVVAHVQALAEPNDAAVLGLISEGADTATKAALNATYGPGTMAPESQFPAGIYNHPPTMQDAAAFAGIAPSAMSLVKSIETRNRIETPLPAMTFMLTGRPSDRVRNLSGITVENVPSPTNPSRTVWKATGDAPGALAQVRCYVTPQEASPGGPDTVPPTTAVTGWVYLTEPEKVDKIEFRVYNSEAGLGSWQRDTSLLDDAWEFKKGWNRYRVSARASDPLRLTNMTECRFSVTPKEGETVTAYFGPMVLEHRPKASVVVMNDWGSKPFLDNAYPSCKANNIPVTWGVRVNRMGDGTYPNNHISVEEAKMLMNENNNVMSFHSWNGNGNDTYTEEEARQVNLLCQAGLAARGLWSEGAVHRMAWVQNLAPNAPGAYDYLVTSGSHTDNYNNISWPPNNPKSIPRWAVHGTTEGVKASIDSNFAELQTTHDAALVYTHAVLPENEPNHASQESWDYFIGKIVEGVNAGWLEAVTIPQLVARERLEIPHNPDEIPLPFEEVPLPVEPETPE